MASIPRGEDTGFAAGAAAGTTGVAGSEGVAGSAGGAGGAVGAKGGTGGADERDGALRTSCRGADWLGVCAGSVCWAVVGVDG